MKSVELFTDGACSGNPGPGGWGALLRFQGNEKELNGGEEETTNNRMELLAVIKGLQSLNQACQVVLTTDSKYVKDGISSWIHNWKRNGWRTKAGKDVKNRDLWEALDEACQLHEIEWKWVKGHSGHEENERVDELARKWIEEYKESH